MQEGDAGGKNQLLTRLGARVRSARVLRRWSVRQLAERTALSERFLGELEAGRANISVRNLAVVAAALDTSAAKLLGDDEPRGLPPVIALLGMRGAGKTSIGQRLARRFKVPFIELDRRVEDAAGLRLGEIFALHGEDYYRMLERRALQKVLGEGRRCVLAVGGGLVTDAEMWSRLRSQAFTIWLRAEPHDYMKRVLAQGDRRPVAGRPGAMHELRRLLREREPLYAQAHVTIDTSRTALAGAVKAALEALS
jgi:XRE family aerobic/anaerobic benzoate catabolism transcriptional regulator